MKTSSKLIRQGALGLTHFSLVLALYSCDDNASSTSLSCASDCADSGADGPDSGGPLATENASSPAEDETNADNDEIAGEPTDTGATSNMDAISSSPVDDDAGAPVSPGKDASADSGVEATSDSAVNLNLSPDAGGQLAATGNSDAGRSATDAGTPQLDAASTTTAIEEAVQVLTCEADNECAQGCPGDSECVCEAITGRRQLADTSICRTTCDTNADCEDANCTNGLCAINLRALVGQLTGGDDDGDAGGRQRGRN